MNRARELQSVEDGLVGEKAIYLCHFRGELSWIRHKSTSDSPNLPSYVQTLLMNRLQTEDGRMKVVPARFSPINLPPSSLYCSLYFRSGGRRRQGKYEAHVRHRAKVENHVPNHFLAP